MWSVINQFLNVLPPIQVNSHNLQQKKQTILGIVLVSWGIVLHYLLSEVPRNKYTN